LSDVQPKRRGLQVSVLVPIIDTIRNIFEFGQGLTSPVGLRKLPILIKKLPSYTIVLQKARKIVDIQFFFFATI
jgi:hypothetical protein